MQVCQNICTGQMSLDFCNLNSCPEHYAFSIECSMLHTLNCCGQLTFVWIVTEYDIANNCLMSDQLLNLNPLNIMKNITGLAANADILKVVQKPKTILRLISVLPPTCLIIHLLDTVVVRVALCPRLLVWQVVHAVALLQVVNYGGLTLPQDNANMSTPGGSNM